MKSSKKRNVVIVIVLIIVLLVLSQPVIKISYLGYAHKWQAAIENFESFEDSFLAIANYAEKYFDSSYSDSNKLLIITKDPDTDVITLYDYKRKYLVLDDETRRCLDDILKAFSHPDYPLYDIVEIDNKIYFHTEKRHYALVYSPNDSRPRRLLGNNIRTSISVKKIKRKWYHVVS